MRSIPWACVVLCVAHLGCLTGLPEVGNEGEPCFDDGTCFDELLCQDMVCRSGSCINGRTQCDGNWIQTCEDNEWVNTTDCSASDMTCAVTSDGAVSCWERN